MNVVDLTLKLEWNDGKMWATRPLSDIDTVVIHHSASEPRKGMTIEAYINAMNNYHISRWDWPRLGYHVIIGPGGMVWLCNAYEFICYHAGRIGMNRRAIGVCLVGLLTKRDPTEAQMVSLRQLVFELRYPAMGHLEIVSTQCPGPWWLAWGKELVNS